MKIKLHNSCEMQNGLQTNWWKRGERYLPNGNNYKRVISKTNLVRPMRWKNYEGQSTNFTHRCGWLQQWSCNYHSDRSGSWIRMFLRLGFRKWTYLNDNAKNSEITSTALYAPLSPDIILTISILLQEKLYSLIRFRWTGCGISYRSSTGSIQEWSTMPKRKEKSPADETQRPDHEKPGSFRAGGIDWSGKTIVVVKTVDIPRAVANFHFYATAALHTHRIPLDGKSCVELYSSHNRFVAGCISTLESSTPFIHLENCACSRRGCTVVAKPSEITSHDCLSSEWMCIEIGFPKGVLNIIHGLGPKVGMAIVSHPKIPWSVSPEVQKPERSLHVLRHRCLKIIIGTGGKIPTSFSRTRDFEKSSSTSVRSSFSNQGEICLCGSRIFCGA